MPDKPAFYRRHVLVALEVLTTAKAFPVGADSASIFGEVVRTENDIMGVYWKDNELHRERMFGDLHSSCASTARCDETSPGSS